MRMGVALVSLISHTDLMATTNPDTLNQLTSGLVELLCSFESGPANCTQYTCGDFLVKLGLLKFESYCHGGSVYSITAAGTAAIEDWFNR